MRTLTYAYKDTNGNEYQQLQKLDEALKDKFQKSRLCEDCGISHLLKDCPMHLPREEKVPPVSIKEDPTTEGDHLKKLPTTPMQPSMKSSSGTPPKSPQKRQILPQKMTNLLKSQVIELIANNVKLDPAEDASMQSAITVVQVIQSSSEPKRQEVAKRRYMDKTTKRSERMKR